MNPTTRFARMFRRYGQKVSLGETGFFAVIQPLRYKNKMYLEGTHTGIGLSDNRAYLLLAEPGAPLEEGAEIGSRGKNYLIIQAEPMLFQGQCVYQRAVLRRGQEETL